MNNTRNWAPPRAIRDILSDISVQCELAVQYITGPLLRNCAVCRSLDVGRENPRYYLSDGDHEFSKCIITKHLNNTTLRAAHGEQAFIFGGNTDNVRRRLGINVQEH